MIEFTKEFISFKLEETDVDFPTYIEYAKQDILREYITHGKRAAVDRCAFYRFNYADFEKEFSQEIMLHKLTKKDDT